MKNNYKIIFFVFLGLIFNLNLYSKNLKCRVISIAANNTSGGNCDKVCIGWTNNQIDWVFDIDDGSTDVSEKCYTLSGDQNTNSITPNFVVWNGDFNYVCEWPGGNIDFNVEGWDQDCADACLAWNDFGNTVSELACRVNVNRSWPLDSNATYGPYTATCNYNRNFDGSGNCAGTITVTYEFIVSGSYVSQTGDDYICGANDMGILNSGNQLIRNNFNNIGYSTEDICSANEPNNDSNDETVWMKFKTSSNPGTSITVDADAIGGSGSGGVLCISGGTVFAWTRVYAGPDNLVGCPFSYSTNHFTQISQVGSVGSLGTDNSLIEINCPKPDQTYYVQVEMQGIATCDMGRFNLTVKDNGIQAGPDKICDALDLGQAAYGGPLSNTTNVDLFIDKQSNACATVAPGELDAFPVQSVDKSVWYKFTTPPAYYLNSPELAQLPHVYTFEVNRIGGTALAWPTFAVWEQTAATTRTCAPENAGSFSNLALVDYSQNLSFGNAELEYLCLKPNKTYYIQIDHASANPVTPADEYVEFSLRVKKAAFRAGDNLCDAFDLGIITSNGTSSGLPNNVTWTNSGKLSAAPIFGLPHTNKCTSAENGENGSTPGGPSPIGGGGNHSATTWYKFTTGQTVPEWIYWYNNDKMGGNGNRGSVCTGLLFNSRVTFFLPEVPTNSCPVQTQLITQPEMNIPGDLCDVSTGLGFGAPCYADLFRLKCPRPNTTYYVQVKDFSVSPCYEGLWTFDNATKVIKTSPNTGGAPANDSICYAIDLGTVPTGGQLAPDTIFNNFCATPDNQWRADFTQPLEADVWFKFKPPASGSVLITAQSGPSGAPTFDNDLDLQVAIWEPILGDATNSHCSDPRFLWTPLIAQDHGVCELSEQQTGFTNCFLGGFFPYDIYKTCGNTLTCNEGNSLIATCLDPNKYYYIQVDGGQYVGCDVLDAGDCVMGYFKLQVTDADLGLINSANTTQNISPYTALGIKNSTYLHDEPCYAQALSMNVTGTAYGSLNWSKMTNRCATSINDPIPTEWAAKNSSTDKTVWATFVAPASGKVKIRAENIAQIKGDADYHEGINLQLALYQTSNCYDKWRLTEVGNGNGFDGAGVEIDPLNSDDYVKICVPGVNNCGFDEYMVARCLSPGQTYYIMIDGEAGYVFSADVEDVEGDFRISVQELNGIPASTNDAICNAYDMESGGAKPSTLPLNGSYTTPIAFNNECATMDTAYEGSGRIAHNIKGTVFNFDVDHTLWFKFKAPSSGKIKIEALNDGSIDPIDLGLAIFDIPSQNCTNIQSQGYKFNQDYDPAVFGIAHSQDEEVTVTCLTPNKWYWVQVDGNRNPSLCGPIITGTDCKTGQFKLKITHLPSDPTYASTVDYTINPDLPGGNDNYCQAHRIKNASGAINIFNNATYLQNGESITFNHNNRCATTEVNEPELNGWNLNPFNSGNTPTVWYAFNTGPILPPFLPGEITIDVKNPSGICFDPDMDLYEYTGPLNNYYNASGCDNLGNSKFDWLFRVGEGTNIPYLPLHPRWEQIRLSCPKPMTTYLLRVAGSSTCPLFGDNMGDFDISIAMSPLPGLDVYNDDICGADNLGIIPSGGTQTKGGNNFCATQQQNEPNTSQNCVQSEPCADETVWFKFTTSATPGEIQITVKDVLALGYIAAPTIAVYRYVGATNYACTSTPFNNLAKLDENSGVVVLAGVSIDYAKVKVHCAQPNTTYYVQVDGIDMALLGFALPGSTDNFAFNIEVKDLGVYTGRALNDNLADAIPIDSTIARPGVYNLPAGGTKSIFGHNICATCEDGEIGDYCGVNETGHTAPFSAEDETVWYYFTTPPNPGIITIKVEDDPAFSDLFSPNFRLYYYNKSMGSPQFRVTQAPSRKIILEGGNPSGISTATGSYTCLLPNTEYYIQVDGNDNMAGRTDQGHFKLTVSDDNSGNPGPSNDLICNAELLPTNMGAKVNKTNKCSWEETGEPNTSNNIGGTGDDVTSNDYDETVWFTFVPTVEQSVRLQLDVTAGLLGGINYVLYEMPNTSKVSCSGTPADIPNWSQLKEIAKGSSTLLVGNEIDETLPCLKPTKRYYIQIDGNDLIGADDVGNFDIQLTSSNLTTPLNDDVCGIGAVPGSFPANSTTGNFGTFTASVTKTFTNQDNRCATQQVGEPDVNGPMNDITDPGYDHTLWYKFVASNTDGTYKISVNNVGADNINAYIGVWRQDDNSNPVCPTTTWNKMTKIKETSSIKVTNDASLDLECWEIEEGKTYYFQIQGIDGLLGGDVGDNFNVSVQFNAGATNLADNICTAPSVNIGTTYSADNRCATTEPNEPNISPVPQSPADGKAYDETLWYQFVAPASGEAKLTVSNVNIGLSINMNLYEAPAGYNCATDKFNKLIPNESSGFLTNAINTKEFRCLAPGQTYYMQFDGNDLLLDRGTWDFKVDNFYAGNTPPANDEPCGAVDVTQHIRSVALGPCTADGQYFTDKYSINTSPRVDQATKTATAVGCDGSLNCNDYWYKFTVPLTATGIRIQGNDEYAATPGINNSTQNIGIYRAPTGCSGPLQRVNCDHGGSGRDVDMTLAAYPGETLYMQVFDANAPANPTYNTFGFCLSVDCPAKTACQANNLSYGQVQCWNMNTNGANLQPQYYDCLPGSNNSVNYFSFTTDCDGTPVDTVTVVFSVTDIGCGLTAMSMFKDNTPCVAPLGQYDEIVVNCAVFQKVTGGTTATNFSSTFILPGCTTYVVQIIGDENTAACASSGQILILPTKLPPTQVLPVELTTFTGYNNGNINVLNWTTASELNTLKFEVEKSIDAITFEYIGERPAAGNSNTPRSYTLNDVHPVIGNNYYRLKMIDKDGKYKYSDIIIIKVNELSQTTDGIVSIYPNPTKGELNIVYQAGVEQKVNLHVFNTLGQHMLSEGYNMHSGMNTITIKVTDFAKGMYILDMQNITSGEKFQSKFIKD
jgi:hypothetical protein